MHIFTRQFFILSLTIISTFVYGQNHNSPNDGRKDYHHYLQTANQLRYIDMDSSVLLFKLSYDKSMKAKDTIHAIQTLNDLSNSYANNADFSQAYDGYWEALILADRIEHDELKGAIYEGLGWLYSFYKRNEKSKEYFNKAISIRKKHLGEDSTSIQSLIAGYYAMVTLHRGDRDIVKSKQYLDSCKLILPGQPNDYLKSESAILKHLEGKHQQALDELLEIAPRFDHYDTPFQIILFSFIAEAYMELGLLNESESYYKQAIGICKKSNGHLDLLPKIYLSLSELYTRRDGYDSAYKYLKVAKELDDRYYGSRSENSKQFLEIKDDFRIEKDRQASFIREQRLTQLEKESQIAYLQSVILGGTIFFLILSGFLLYRYLRTRYKAEKKLMVKQQEMEMQRAREVLEVKNKELTASALQVIQREELLSDLKAKLNDQKGHSNSNELRRLAKQIDLNTANNWKEFETRFVAVNKSFYKRLKVNYPDLNQSDQRLCALVKLNFSSKDMSRLLGISVESVHTTRYRLRKKLGLEKNANLTEFISNL